jgi:tetratricopeptide (TPR) repeat protein
MATAIRETRAQDQAGTPHIQENPKNPPELIVPALAVLNDPSAKLAVSALNQQPNLEAQLLKVDSHVTVVARNKFIKAPVAECIYQTELENVQSASKGTTGKINKVKTVTFVGGDIFSAIFLILQGIKPFIMPSIAAAGAGGPLGLGIVLCVFGVLGGALTMVVGGLDMKAGIDTLKKCHSQYKTTHQISWEGLFLGIRLLIGGIFEIAVGAMMIAIPIVLMVAATSGFALFLAANPWLLPLLFVIPTLCFAFELVPKIYRMIKQTTLPQLLNVNDLFKSLKDSDTAKSNSLLQTWKEQFTKHVINSLAANARKNRHEQALKAIERLLAKQNKDQVLDQTDTKELTLSERIILKNDTDLDLIIKDEAIESEKQKALEAIEFTIGLPPKEKLTSAEQKILKTNREILFNKDVNLDEKQKALKAITDLGKKKSLNKEEKATKALNEKLLALSDEELYQRIQNTTLMSHLELEMGIEGALAAFDLYNKINLGTEAESLQTEISTLNDKSNEWIRVQKIKIAIQAIYLISFIISMGTIGVPAGLIADIANLVTNVGLAVANGLPGYLDAFKKFLRNTPLTTDELTVLQTMGTELTEFAAKDPDVGAIAQ